MPLPLTRTRRGALRASALTAGAALGVVARPHVLVMAQGQMPDFAPEAGSDDTAAVAGIQSTLDRQADARARGDRDAFMATIDQRNLTWRRIQSDTFASDTPGGWSPVAYAVTRVQAKGLGYAKAWIDLLQPRSRAVIAQVVWVFRQAESGWLHSEILNEEIGPRKQQDTDHFTLAYFAWDDDVIDRMAGVAEAAYARVTEKTGIVPAERTTVGVNPTYGAHSALRGAGTWALYLPGSSEIQIRSIESFGAGFTLPGETQESRLLIPLTHEYAHLVNNVVVSTARMRKWMVEGFAEWVAGNLRAGALRAALRVGRLLTLDEASDIIEWGIDPGRGYTDDDVALAYAHAAHGTAYFMETYGQDQFFALAKDFAGSRKWEESFFRTVGVEWPDFEAAWIAWARGRLL